MKIETISRKITGDNYDNISISATLSEEDDPVKTAVELDHKLQIMLKTIYEQNRNIEIITEEKKETISILEAALEYAKKYNEIPF